jgi:putative N-acetylmannosamine-6-phosphate epimerase
MSTTQPLLDGLDAYLEYLEQRASTGLNAACADVTGLLKATTAHGDITGATRAGYVAYVIGGTVVDEAKAVQALNTSVASVERLNPGESATASGTIGADSIGAALTSPTTYQDKLESEYAGMKAVLGPTIQTVATEFTRRAAEGS